MRPVPALAIALAACTPEPPPAPCNVTVHASGATTLDWDDTTPVECEGFGPSIADGVDLYWNLAYDSVRVRVDYILAGDTGTFDGDDTFVSVYHEDDEWGSFGNVACTVVLDRHEQYAEATRFGPSRWAIEGSARCDRRLEPFQSEGTVDLGEIVFASSYEHWED